MQQEPPNSSPEPSGGAPEKTGSGTQGAPGAPQAPAFHVAPIPTTGISKVLGLAEMLDDHGGKEDIYKLAKELRDSFGELLIIIKAGEILGIFDTPGGDLVMLPLGHEMLKLPVKGKKEIIARQIAGLPLFEHFKKFLEAREDHSASRDEILEELALVLPSERPKAQYDALLNWGRYAEIFGYSRDDDRFYLVAEAPTEGP